MNTCLFENRAVLSIAGFSGSGKTTLLASLCRHLCAKNLRVAVVKHDVHDLEVDRPGKDSDRLFESGADVTVIGQETSFDRKRGGSRSPIDAVASALDDHDVVLVEGFKRAPFRKIWLFDDAETPIPDDIRFVELTLSRSVHRVDAAAAHLDRLLDSVFRHRPIYGGILVGGQSRRMGRPKQLLEWKGRPFLDHVASALSGHCSRLFLLGKGEFTLDSSAFERLSDVENVRGPLAAILSAVRHAPEATWIIAACDMPLFSSDAVAWLLSMHRFDRVCVLPRIEPDRVESTAALYDGRVRVALERLALSASFGVHRLTSEKRVCTPEVPNALRICFSNVNTEAEWKKLGQSPR